MKITPNDIAKARALFADPLIHAILGDLEAAAVNTGVYAPSTDNDARQAAMAEVRAIRALRSKLKNLAERKGEDE